jgi:diguanylate cyclase (GGDEF)-like protein/PAS domain S-box-containing protein
MRNDGTSAAGFEDRFAAIMENFSDGVLVTDAAGIVRFNNSAAEVLLDRRNLAGSVFDHAVRPGQTRHVKIGRWPGISSVVELRGFEIVWDGRPARVIMVRDVSTQARAEEDLRQERDFNTSLVQNSPAFFAAVGREGKTLMMNDAILQALGYGLDEILGTDYLETFLTETDRRELLSLYGEIARNRKPAVIVNRIASREGRTFLVEWHIKPVFKDDDEIHYFINLGIDITGRREAEARLRESEDRYRSLLEASFEGIAIHENGVILDANAALEALFGYQPAELIGMTAGALMAEESREKVMQNIVAGRQEPYETVCLRKDGAKFNAEIREKPHMYKGRSVRVIVLRDVTELVSLREKLVAMSNVDELTDLSNRRGFFLLAHQQILLANRNKKGIVLLFVDLDNMKWINDTLGHSAGDQALVDTAAVLRESLRKSDIIARIGGDEFVIFAIEAKPKTEGIIIERLRKNLQRFNDLRKREYELSVSVGAAYYDPEKPSTLEVLLSMADAEMYEQKRQKKTSHRG